MTEITIHLDGALKAYAASLMLLLLIVVLTLLDIRHRIAYRTAHRAADEPTETHDGNLT